jgi:hypothetical protein
MLGGQRAAAFPEYALVPVGGVTPAVASTLNSCAAYPDLIGMPPTADEAACVPWPIKLPTAHKVYRPVVCPPHYARHMASTLDLMLMEPAEYERVGR